MKAMALLCISLLASSAGAGTFRDDFNDGNWAGWEMIPNNKQRFSVVDGVIRLLNFNTPEFETDLIINETDWTDYTFSADMRIIQVEQSD
jgi:hypothetical protein